MSSNGRTEAPKAPQGHQVRIRWTLTGEAFDRLLAALGPDPDRAAVAYEHLRERTIGLLRWWGASRPEELTDETLDRVARKLAEGASVAEGSLGAYVRGVARLVFYEARREPLAPLSGREVALAPSTSEIEAASQCLDRCLAALSSGDRTLLVRYYGVGRAAAVRRELADELGISMTALRIRAHRLRAPVERCVTACLAQRGLS